MKVKNNKRTGWVLSVIGLVLFLFLLTGVSLQVQAQTYGNVWDHGDVIADVDLRDLIRIDGRFVAVGYKGHVYVSSNGKNWTKKNTSLDVRDHLFGVAYGNGTLVAVGRDRVIIYSENNGDNWSTAHARVFGTDDIYKVAYGDGKFVAVDEGGGIWTSDDGKTGWEMYPTGENTRHIRFGNGFFLIGLLNGNLLKSDSGDRYSWTPVGNAGSAVRGLVYGNNKWLAVGKKIATANANGTGWTVRVTLTNYNIIDTLYCVGTAPGSYIAAGEHGLMLNSADGITWRKGDSGTQRFIMGMAYSSSQDIVAVVGNGGPRDPDPNAAIYLYSTHYSEPGGTPPPVLGTGGGSGTLTVTAPNGGEQWEAGKEYDIRWTTTGTVGNVNIDVSTDGKKTWSRLTSGTPNDGLLSWTINTAFPNSTSCYIRIVDVDGAPVDTSNSAFTITGGTGGGEEGTITVTSPNGGEEWEMGSSHDITWTSTGTVGSVKLEYTTDNGSTWTLFDAVAKNDGVRPWVVPDEPSPNCKIRITSVDNESILDTSNTTFTIVDSGPSTLTLTSPNGGETWSVGSGHTISWTSTGYIGTVKLEYSLNNGSSWTTIDSSTHNDGGYSWTLPNSTSSECLVQITSNSKPDVSDTCDSTFSIVPVGGFPTIVVISPNGNEEWETGSTQTISWAGSESISAVKIDYTTNDGGQWKRITSDAPNNNSFSWTVPDEPSTQCKIRITDAAGSTPTDTSNITFTIFESEPAQIALNRTQFNFGYALNGNVPGSQSLAVSNDGGKALNWSASGDQSWINLNPVSGNGGTLVDISIDPGGLGVGQYSGTVTISDPDATNSPQTVTVNLNVINASDDQAPFGDMASPVDGLIAAGGIPVTGWVLDDVDIQSVTLYYNENSVIGDAVFVEGARPDIEEAYPGYPRNASAGWGYMLLTNSLPDDAYSIYAVATDINGKTTMFGPSNITIDNAGAVKPFGAMDAPLQGGSASGDNYVNWGWALTPQPNTIPTDGSTIQVWVDGALKGTVDGYDVPNANVAALFPGYQNSAGPTGYFHLDTTEYTNGVHYIAWTVADDAGNTEGIGSRYFTILNSGGSASRVSHTTAKPAGFIVGGDLFGLPVDRFAPLRIKKGFHPAAEARIVSPGEKGMVYLEMNQLERIEIQLSTGLPLKLKGYLKVGEDYRPLPVGSTLDAQRGIFSWQAGHASMGSFHFVFIAKQPNGQLEKKEILVTVHPKEN